MGQDLEAAIAQNLAFWRGEQVDRPLVGVWLGGFMVDDVDLVASDGDLLEPEQLIPQRFFDLLEARCEAAERLDQGLIRPVSPPTWFPWLEAILGCSIRVHSPVCWAEPLLAEDEPLETLQIGRSEAWLKAGVTFVRALVERYHERFPVAGLFLRGPADVIAAMLGTERMCYEFYDHPRQIHRLARQCAEAWIEISQLICEYIPPFRGGYVDAHRWLYSPGRCAYSSEDATSIISSQLHHEFFLPYNQLIAGAFPYGYIHRHSASAHNLTALLDLAAPWAIDVAIDPTGPTVSEMLPIFQRIQERGRPLIVFGLEDELDIAELVSNLSPTGLCVHVHACSEEKAKALLAAAKEVRGGPGVMPWCRQGGGV